ncbi:unnamed protein product [Linum tenue]|uniref:Hapless 8 n=1 Tax=Linum tenue TaxID=586396 RepID=A0AAV0IH28_9ROSI|nr:unnamed protein product [Linum tenue]
MLSSIDQNLLPPPDPSSPHVLPSQFSNSSSPSPSSTSSSPSSKPSLPQLQQPVPSPEVELEADLPNPLHSFSIRDYVFTARSKDIKTNWPFSSKNLQLCLNHGLTEVLPPFQPLDTIRNLQSFGSSHTVKEPPITTIFDKVNSSKFDIKKNDGLLEPSSDDTDTVVKLTEKKVDTISSCRHVEEDGNSFPSLTTTTTTSDGESLPKASLKASKKCRLVVKFGDRGVSAENIASTTTTVTPIVSESSLMMASKVCPVCKTFSSSSNTTLNAHIDQCLSVESSSAPPKWTADDDDDHAKVAKHHNKVKPRRTRLMVDIYKTAPRCTLEELDRRNGRLSSLAMEEIDEDETTCSEEKSERVKPVQAKKSLGDVGPVYIDESGTKVRILSSNFDEVSPVVARRVGETGGGMNKKNKKKKCLRGSKNMVALKKRESLIRKHKKYLKLAAQSKKLFSDKTTHSSQIRGNHEQPANLRTFSDEELHASQQQIPPGNNSGNLRPWVCSKPRGTPTKINNHHQEDHQQQQPPIRSHWHSLAESDNQSFPVGDSSEESTGIQKFTNLSENLAFCHERIEKNKVQQVVSIKRKRGRPLSRRPVITGDEDVGKYFGLMKQKFVESNRDDHRDRSLKPPNACKNKVTESLDKLPSVHSVVEARKKKIKKGSNLKEPQVHLLDERRDTLSAGNCDVDQQYDMMHDHREYQLESDVVTEELACGDGNARTESRQIEGMMICSDLLGKEQLGLINLDSVSPGLDSTRELVHGDDIGDESLSKTTEGMHGGASLSKSIDTVLYSVKDASKLSMEDYRGFLSGSEAPTDSAEPDFVNEHEMATEMDAEIDSGEAENGMDSFPELDPIPIPGPPGSFLPSPRDMGDDFQGNSSVTTTSRAQSSLDIGNVVDKDSSESPISAASSISNSTTTAQNGCGLDFVESKRSLGSMAVTRIDIEPHVQNGDILPVSKPCIEKDINTRLDRNHLDKGSFTVANPDNHQPCCCQRKERVPLAPASIVLNQHDSSLLLRRRKTAAASMMIDHPSGKLKGCSSTSIPRSLSTFDTRTEYAPPSTCPTSGADAVGFQVIKPHLVPSMDYESSSPSTPNPVLRLMGKNLMVVSKDDEASKPPYLQQQLTTSSHPQNHYSADPQFPKFSTIGNVRNHEPRLLHQMVPHPHSSAVFPRNLHGHHVSPYSNVGLTNAAAVYMPNGMFHNYSPQCNPLATNAYSSPSPHCTKEVIIIDDDPERAHPAMTNKLIMKYGEGNSIRETNNHVIPSGSMYLPGGMQSNYSPNHMHSIACYPPSQEHHHTSPMGESSSPIVRANRFHLTTPSNIRYSADSSRMLHQSPLQAAAAAAPPPPPSSDSVLRSSSAMYYSPSFS